MQIALCRRVMSPFCATNAMVTSPGTPFGVEAGMGMR